MRIFEFIAAIMVASEIPLISAFPGGSNNYVTSFCTVRLRSYANIHPGCETTDHRYGYIMVNGNLVANSTFPESGIANAQTYRGVNTVVLNPSKCTGSDWRQFDTFASTSETGALVDYLNYLDNGIIILMVSFDDPIRNLAPAAKLLKLATRVDIASMGLQSKFAAVIQKGYPHKTAIVTAPPNCVAPELVVKIVGVTREEVELTPI